jgi:hypothetical protein
MKYGMIARRSMMLRGPLKNFHLFGDAQIRARYSNVNQPMHTAYDQNSYFSIYKIMTLKKNIIRIIIM